MKESCEKKRESNSFRLFRWLILHNVFIIIFFISLYFDKLILILFVYYYSLYKWNTLRKIIKENNRINNYFLNIIFSKHLILTQMSEQVNGCVYFSLPCKRIAWWNHERISHVAISLNREFDSMNILYNFFLDYFEYQYFDKLFNSIYT